MDPYDKIALTWTNQGNFKILTLTYKTDILLTIRYALSDLPANLQADVDAFVLTLLGYSDSALGIQSSKPEDKAGTPPPPTKPPTPSKTVPRPSTASAIVLEALRNAPMSRNEIADLLVKRKLTKIRDRAKLLSWVGGLTYQLKIKGLAHTVDRGIWKAT